MCRNQNSQMGPDEFNNLRSILQDLDTGANNMSIDEFTQVVEVIYRAFILDNPEWESS